nr:MAG TPA: SMODS and SLOG-associating 2TM effector domain family 4 [Caudoviricetes sp.]
MGNDKNKINYYEKLKSIGDTVSVLSIILGIIMILGLFPTMVSDGPVFTLFIAIVITFLFGSAINKLFFCIAEMAKNSEKQTELLEKLVEKLDK